MTRHDRNPDLLRAQRVMASLETVWNRATAQGLDLPTLIDLRCHSREYAFACQDQDATLRTIELEQWAERLYRQTRVCQARSDRRFTEKVIEGILRTMGRALEEGASSLTRQAA